MVLSIVIEVLAAWVLLAVLLAALIGRAVGIADGRRRAALDRDLTPESLPAERPRVRA